MKKRVAIVGGAESRRLAPFDDLSWEIWSLNNIYPDIPRRDRWFEIHHIYFDGLNFYRRGQKDFRGKPVNNYLEDLSKLNCPIYMQKPWPIIPLSRAFPLQEILSKFRRYFTSTIAYMIAMTINERYEEVSIFGVDMGFDDEYANQRPCLEYLFGIAEGQGIKVNLLDDCPILKAQRNRLYGFEDSGIDLLKQQLIEKFILKGGENVKENKR